MAGRLDIKVRGLKAARGSIRKLEAEVRDNLGDEIEVLVKKVEGEAKRIVPRKTANLQRTIASEVEEKKGAVIGLVGANTIYAERLEDPKSGLRHASRSGFVGKPTPYLIPALSRNLKRIVAGISKGIRRATKKAAR